LTNRTIFKLGLLLSVALIGVSVYFAFPKLQTAFFVLGVMVFVFTLVREMEL
jgi:hypothetical protein